MRMPDYKDRVQFNAEQLAVERYERDYFDLPDALQDEIYREAIKVTVDIDAEYADWLRDRSHWST